MAPNLEHSGAPGPLKGVRVLDLSRLVAGNMLTLQLADFGAEVVKVEPPEGDTLRQWKVQGVATSWKTYARNKKSLCLNLRDPQARDILLRLADAAQVLIESFRPGTLENMGLAPGLLHSRNPGLIVVRISGWGQQGPYSRRPGFGTLVEGMSGFASMNGFPDREPVLPPIYLADSIAGLYGASAVLVALREVEARGGRGQVIDLPLLDAMVSVLGPQAANYRLTGKVKQRTGSRSTNSAPRNAYCCRDGKWVCLAASTQQMAERLFRSIGRDDLIADPRYRINAQRVEHAAELDAIIGAFIARRTQAENVAFFERAEVTIGPIYDVAQLVEDPHVVANELVTEIPDEDMGSMPMHNVVPRLTGTPGAIRAPAPRLGEHNAQLLGELGYGAGELRHLIDRGVVCDADHQPSEKGAEE
jgi:crotonobetainyl-CoA:carnitine CoA-transferase CaiB-like acyl-CoA transferase